MRKAKHPQLPFGGGKTPKGTKLKKLSLREKFLHRWIRADHWVEDDPFVIDIFLRKSSGESYAIKLRGEELKDEMIEALNTMSGVISSDSDPTAVDSGHRPADSVP